MNHMKYKIYETSTFLTAVAIALFTLTPYWEFENKSYYIAILTISAISLLLSLYFANKGKILEKEFETLEKIKAFENNKSLYHSKTVCSKKNGWHLTGATITKKNKYIKIENCKL
ncbi:MAG: hypothetical protein U9N59_07125 [Campylobacterota bacterium]|nr:hypothetical protein [Campylobacterota bacterium]